VIRILRAVYDDAAWPVEVQESVMAADRHEFRYERGADEVTR
jgi:GntR family transcriptional regulator